MHSLHSAKIEMFSFKSGITDFNSTDEVLGGAEKCCLFPVTQEPLNRTRLNRGIAQIFGLQTGNYLFSITIITILAHLQTSAMFSDSVTAEIRRQCPDRDPTFFYKSSLARSRTPTQMEILFMLCNHSKLRGTKSLLLGEGRGRFSPSLGFP